MNPEGPTLRRREIGILAAALGGCAMQPSVRARPAGAVLAPPMPCAERPGDVVGLVLEGTGAPAGTIVVFGQAFRPGDMPREAGLVAQLAGGLPLPAQLDARTWHPDGSVRFGLVSLAVPWLSAGARQAVILAAGPRSNAAHPGIAFGDHQAILQLAGAGGEPWQVDLLALFRAAIAGGTVRPWQSGPLATQARVTVSVPPAAAGGATSLRLVADIALRADGSLWVEPWLRNDVAMRPGGGTASYRLRLILDGREALSTGTLRQPLYTAWGRLFGSGPGGRPAAVPPLVCADAAYLAETGVVARYDLSTGVENAVLARFGEAITAPAWAEPLGPRGITQYMPTTGGRQDIGPATTSQAAWLITGDRRAAAYATGQAEAAGAIPWHIWDPEGGTAGAGGWMDVLRWPRLWTDGRGGPPPDGLLQPVPGDTGWTPDTAHQPDLSYVPYLLTGRRAFLDELLAQAAWSVMTHWPAYRATHAETLDLPRGEGVNLVRGNQVRGAAWSLRQLDDAAWACPADHPNHAYFRVAAAGNWAWLRAQLPAWTALQGEAHGWIPGVYRDAGAVPPWQQDYFASTAAAAARRGSADARIVLAWMENFLAGRFLAADKGFNPRDGIAYNIAVAPATAPEQPFRSWAGIGAETRARGWSNGSGWGASNGDYAQLALQSLAALQDVLGSAMARQAYAWLSAAGAPFTRPADYARDPTFNIVPRDLPRVPGQATPCRPALPRSGRAESRRKNLQFAGEGSRWLSKSLESKG